MKQRNVKHEKRLKRLVLTCLLCAIVLTVSTYAWFIGMQTVTVNTFEVNIAAVEDLALSLDGEAWSTELSFDEKSIMENAYAKKTASWSGLIPVSTVGLMDADTSKLILYDKGSLTATPGGYRLMSARVANKAQSGDDSGEVDGYVAFDLFIKNMSGDAYYDSITEPSNEEAVYLAKDSAVVSSNAGTDTSGIENSVRVAFAQIGRVKSDAVASAIQGISCKTATGVTPICTNRKAYMWEPNDMAHVPNAITWFTKTCKKRAAEATEEPKVAVGDYTGTNCTAIKDNQYYDTYAVSGVIDHSAKVDVYDGLNGYFGTVGTTEGANKLYKVDYFTDTEKDMEEALRPPFMTLAPNSITKVRVYIYLEGQDVDNYDFASLGSSIKVNFGFTKERFDANEIGVDENAGKTEENKDDQTENEPQS